MYSGFRNNFKKERDVALYLKNIFFKELRLKNYFNSFVLIYVSEKPLKVM